MKEPNVPRLQDLVFLLVYCTEHVMRKSVFGGKEDRNLCVLLPDNSITIAADKTEILQTFQADL